MILLCLYCESELPRRATQDAHPRSDALIRCSNCGHMSEYGRARAQTARIRREQRDAVHREQARRVIMRDWDEAILEDRSRARAIMRAAAVRSMDREGIQDIRIEDVADHQWPGSGVTEAIYVDDVLQPKRKKKKKQPIPIEVLATNVKRKIILD